MSAFESCRAIEAEGLAVLKPYLDAQAEGRLVMSSKGKLAKWLQETSGDAVIQARDGRMVWLELKVERKHTGNLFLEEWSNRNLDHRANHAEFGSNPGWLAKLRADLILYYFLDSDDLYSVDTFSLQRWAYGFKRQDGVLTRGNLHRWSDALRDYEFRQLAPARQQANDTVGVIVPIGVLSQELPPRALKHTKVRQRALLEETA